ncbi:hypothetical protein JOD57_001143 [Geodermatophilus bullaregiensis]|uniref:hypothetical protein n=1 Tax=Geodermatophilus bullaregiensis TaxID=1564160 RepID=UPI00195CC1CC|nr:hypothetical protein [Geodermatophilus bullaregiensis]MBM7805306.1 hypothetical protein [Geodermatophilus bullaregiensis]
MATIETTSGTLRVSLTRTEKVLGLLRDLEVPLSAVRSVAVVPDGVAAARGVRAPGLGLPGLRLIGTWRRRGSRTLVSVRRGRPTVRVELAGQCHDTVLVSADDAAAVAAALDAQLAGRR